MHKEKGNKALLKGYYLYAIKKYSQAILLDPTDKLLYSNRCLCFLKFRDTEKAIVDADIVLTLDPKFTKVVLSC